MSGWMMNMLGARKDTKQNATEAIVGIREQLAMLDKKEEHLTRLIDEQHNKAKKNAISNKAVATAALKRKHELERQRDQLGGTRLTLETQVNAIESAHFNAQTVVAMRQGARVLQSIHKQLDVTNVEDTMEDIREQMDMTQQIANAISNPINVGLEDLDEEELSAELAGLEQEVLDERLSGADRVPVASPVSRVSRVEVQAMPVKAVTVEDDEEEELRQLQASLAM